MSVNDPELLAGFPTVVTHSVAWGDMDAMGHVNNAVYFRYFESARIAYFEATGFFARMESNGLGPILAHTECRFRLPLTYPDDLHSGARVIAIGDDRVQMEYRVVSLRHAAVAAEGTARVVSYDYEAGAKAPLPESVRGAIMTFEGRDLPAIRR